jgi:hypothetical protein
MRPPAVYIYQLIENEINKETKGALITLMELSVIDFLKTLLIECIKSEKISENIKM